jgi:hypothetical protein
LTPYLAGLFLANFIFIFLKAFQQRNVGGSHYLAVIPTSLALALVEVYIIVQVATGGFNFGTVVALGLAGGSGSIAAIWSHKKVFR